MQKRKYTFKGVKMIEIIIKQYLDKHMGVPIYLEHQEREPHRFIIFEKTSSNSKNKINSATIAFQSYAESMYEAAKLNEKLKEVVLNMVELNDIGCAKLNSDYNYTDTQTKRNRYQAVFDITY